MLATMPSRRELLAGAIAGVSLTAGCLGNEQQVARCSSRGEGDSSQHLRRVAPITGEKQVALGVLVSEQTTHQRQYHAVQVRTRDGSLVASIPLMDDRGMSRLDPDDYSIFTSEGGELYAVPLGPPPVHGDFTVSLVDPTAEPIANASIRFNCYSYDGSLP
jgi:hypothetical protein